MTEERTMRGRVVVTASRTWLWRVAVAVSFAASILRSGAASHALPALAWYVLQFGPLAATAAYLLTLDRVPQRKVDRDIAVSFGLFVVVALLSSAANPAPGRALSQVGILLLVVSFLILTMSRRWTTSEAIQGDMVLVFGLICATQLVGLAGAATGQAWAIGDYGRFLGVLANANYVGMLCAPGILLGAHIVHTRGRRAAVLPVVGILILAVALVLSGSRGALLAVAAGALALLLFRESRRTALLLLAGVVVVVLYSVAGAGSPSRGAPPERSAGAPTAGVSESASSAASPPAGAPTTSPKVALSDSPFMHTPAGYDFTGVRIPLYRAALARWAEKPWLGTGYRTTQSLQEMQGQEAHNVYLSVLVEMGVLGAAVFAALLFMILRAAPRMGPERLLLGSAVAVLACELTESSLFGWGGPSALLAWLMLFALAASGRTQGAGRSSPGVGPETP